MTKCEKDRIYLMREQGESYQYIADKFGVSRQCIHQIVTRKLKFKTSTICIYKGLSKWIFDHRTTSERLCEMASINVNRVTMTKKLNGKNEFSLSEIKKILKLTNLTFEECFSEKETPGAATPRESR
ncbi:hypothetical protein BXY41_108104 [Lacrimispora xylanisolvens]|uniref:Uncharacterized protein n=1 Tax=Lacrimispora xylanisolvens TaxID=384636 RepID=A0A2S6HQI4_9FIRM|nr:hypothetical protein [Hungatella xylanolytica]PPK79879.1 hypothetical protein BXY41_108104 [Hungatella xylanolytica]